MPEEVYPKMRNVCTASSTISDLNLMDEFENLNKDSYIFIPV